MKPDSSSRPPGGDPLGEGNDPFGLYRLYLRELEQRTGIQAASVVLTDPVVNSRGSPPNVIRGVRAAV